MKWILCRYLIFGFYSQNLPHYQWSLRQIVQFFFDGRHCWSWPYSDIGNEWWTNVGGPAMLIMWNNTNFIINIWIDYFARFWYIWWSYINSMIMSVSELSGVLLNICTAWRLIQWIILRCHSRLFIMNNYWQGYSMDRWVP